MALASRYLCLYLCSHFYLYLYIWTRDQREAESRPSDGIGICICIWVCLCISRPWTKEMWSGGHLMALASPPCWWTSDGTAGLEKDQMLLRRIYSLQIWIKDLIHQKCLRKMCSERHLPLNWIPRCFDWWHQIMLVFEEKKSLTRIYHTEKYFEHQTDDGGWILQAKVP